MNNAAGSDKKTERLKVVKIGGKMIDDVSKLNLILDTFAQVQGPKILVHGGASKSDEILEKLSIEKVKIDGRRITDEKTLEVCIMVYAGLLNKQIVADLSQRGTSALGMCGADLNSIECDKRSVGTIDYGYVGDLKKINDKAIASLLNQGITLIFSAITHNNKGQLLNTNSDTVAASIANAMMDHYEVELQFIFDRAGVVVFKEDEELVLPEMTKDRFKQMQTSGAIKDGLIPKLDNGFDALENGIKSVRMGGPEIMKDRHSGTKLIQS